MEPSEARELKQLREENAKLKRIVADLSLDKVMLQDVLQKKGRARQEARDRALFVGPIRCGHHTGLPGGADLTQLLQVLQPSRPAGQESLRRRIVELAHARVRYGYRRVFMLLKREGLADRTQTGLSDLYGRRPGFAT